MRRLMAGDCDADGIRSRLIRISSGRQLDQADQVALAVRLARMPSGRRWRAAESEQFWRSAG
jgi:hypothetical protein